MAKLPNEKELQVRLELLSKKISLSFTQKRNELKRAQDDLDDYGYSRKTVQRIESGATDYTLSDLVKMCMTFEISLTDLLDIPELDSPDSPKENKAERKQSGYALIERGRGSSYWSKRAEKAKKAINLLTAKKKKK